MKQPILDTSPLTGDELQDVLESMPLKDSDIVESLGLGGIMTIWRWKKGESECEGPYALAMRNMEAIREFYGLTKKNQSTWSETLKPSEVKKRRVEAKLYQTDIASMMGLSPENGRGTISRWENGITPCSGVYAFLMRSLSFLTKSSEITERKISKNKAGKMQVIEALSSCDTLNGSAELLGVSRRTLNRYLNKYELDKTEYGF